MQDARARELLEAERQRLLALRDGHTGQHLAESLADSTSELSAFDQHPGDVASDTAERAKDLSVLEHVEAHLQEIDEAVRRVDEGRFGICEGTGERIPDERLEAEPTARYTVDYQAEMERRAQA